MSVLCCPYCAHEQNVDINDYAILNQDDGDLHQQECGKCEKMFVVTADISVDYDVFAADCLNGMTDHQFIAHLVYHKNLMYMQCDDCGTRRSPTPDDLKIYCLDQSL